jgi:hypothetical protein
MHVVTKDANESRLEYLLRVAIEYINDNPYSLIYYDEAVCDVGCLVDELRLELDTLKGCNGTIKNS